MMVAIRRALSWAALESWWLTITFWSATAAYAISFWLCRFPPCVDYPQHLAIGAVIGRMMEPGSPERALYDVHPFTYNGGFHFAVALLSKLVAVETAGKLLLSLIPLLVAASSLAWMRWSERPRWYAFFVLPFSFGHVVGWGFVNYALAAPVGVLALVGWLRYREGRRAMGYAAAGLTLVVAVTHVFATLCTVVCVAVAFLAAEPPPSRQGLGRYLLRAARGALPMLPAGLYSILVYRVHRVAPNADWAPAGDGADYTAWSKLHRFTDFSVGNLASHADTRLFSLLLAVLFGLFLAAFFFRGASRGGPPRVPLVLAIVWSFLLLITPRVWMSTAFIFERVPPWTVLFIAGAAPTPARWSRAVLSVSAALLACAMAGTAIQAMRSIPDERDADAIIDAIPPGARVLAVMKDHDAQPIIERPIYLHFAAYHVVRRPGELAFSFTRFGSLPLSYRPETVPPKYAAGGEWRGTYNPRSDYARYFDHILVRTTEDDDDPRVATFGDRADRAKLIARHGRFWLYDASDLDEDDARLSRLDAGAH